MAFYGYEGDADKLYYDFAPTPIQAYSSPYDSGEPQLFHYKSSAYHTNNSFITPSELNYSVYTYSEPTDYRYDYYEYSVNPSERTYSEPKHLQYDPPPYDRGYFLPETKFTISYSTVEFNEPEFEEYDPTPYGGGYDPVTTYGKPLPPSDTTCYPKSVPQSDNTSLENFSYASIPSPYGKDDDDDLPAKSPNETKPMDTKTDTETHVENGADVAILEPSDVIPGDDSSSYEDQNGFENVIREDYGYGSERQVPQIPYGSGLEAMDLCESIFGYWPCLAKRQQQERSKCDDVCDQERRMDPWKNAADYLFGSPLVCDHENYHHPQYDCYENSWLQ